MKNNVINFETGKIRVALRKFEATGEVSDYLLDGESIVKEAYSVGHCSTVQRVKTMLEINKLYAYIDFQEQFNIGLAEIKNNFKTIDADFMFPTVLSKYRKGINPVDALYNSLQEALFKFHEDIPAYNWVVSLFEDGDWLDKLLQSMTDDMNAIRAFIKKYISSNGTFITKELKNLQLMHDHFMHYTEVFLMVRQWSTEND